MNNNRQINVFDWWTLFEQSISKCTSGFTSITSTGTTSAAPLRIVEPGTNKDYTVINKSILFIFVCNPPLSPKEQNKKDNKALDSFPTCATVCSPSGMSSALRATLETT